jgi:hypothetical protein
LQVTRLFNYISEIQKNPHSDAENIILPTLVNAQAIKRVKLIPLSADIIARRIQDMSKHFADNQEPIFKLWALQIGESTDISNKFLLLAYLCTGISMNESIQSQFLFCSELKKNIESIGIK